MKLIKILTLLLISNLVFAQNNFELKLTANEYVNDSLWFGVPLVKNGFGDLYQFKLDENKNVKDISKNINAEYSFYSLSITNENILKGNVDYPQPVAFIFMDKKAKAEFETDIFFIEKGKYQIQLRKIVNGLSVNIETPTNIEYQKFKKYLAPLYFKFKDLNRRDSLTDLNKKEAMISTYIKKNPSSYVALWEMINDYTFYDYKPIYFENMKLFSKELKNSKPYKLFQNKLLTESKTMVGSQIPDIYFDKTHSLTEKDYKKYKLTFIDYWSTTCPPCIKAMPDLVKLRNDFHDKGVKFIFITDESKPERIALAKKILEKNGATWTNYFDANKDFSKKLNATAYPLHFLIDSNGVILARTDNETNETREIITEKLKQEN